MSRHCLREKGLDDIGGVVYNFGSMTQLLTANIGGFPRIGEEKDQQRHRRALTHLQNREISSHAFHDVEQSVTQEVIREQILTGVDEVTDGHVSWHDPISHFCRNLYGVKLTSLSRFFDTNTYFRTPVFTGRPKRRSPHVLNDFIFLQNTSNKSPRVVLTGPYTLARNTRATTRSLNRLQARLAFFTELLQTEISALVMQGAQFIQIDEPALPRFPEDIELCRKALEKIALSMGQARFILALYFAPLAPIYDAIRTLPVHVLNMDFTYDGRKLLEKIILHPPGPALGLGLINGRNTRMEPIDIIMKTVRTWAGKSQAPFFYLTPSCGLEFLPRKYAFEKLKLLTRIQREFQEHPTGEKSHEK